MLPFSVVGEDAESTARAAELTTPHGVVHTPAFMPVGTTGTLKGMAAWELERLGPEMILANTYHLLLRLGTERIVSLGGLHRVMGWEGPILTDSGGYQVYSLAKRRKVEPDGVVFRSHIDGSEHRLTPESVIETQAFELPRSHALDRSGGAHRHESRRVDDTVGRGQLSGPSRALSLFTDNRKRKHDD